MRPREVTRTYEPYSASPAPAAPAAPTCARPGCDLPVARAYLKTSPAARVLCAQHRHSQVVMESRARATQKAGAR